MRSVLVLFFIFVFGAAIIGRLVFLQIINHDFYKALAAGQQNFLSAEIWERQGIFMQDKEGNLYPLATNKISTLLAVSPRGIKEKEETAKILAGILDLEEQPLKKKFQKDTLYELIKKDLTDQEIKDIEEKNLVGVYLKEEKTRRYPQKTMAANVVGFFGGTLEGQYGLEGYWDNVLKESSLITTLDYNIQYLAKKLLSRAQEGLVIEGGQIIVMEPSTGRILAMAQLPDFDPNEYTKVDDISVFQNGSLQKIFEPGSVFKAITMASGLDAGRITPYTTYVDEGKVKIGGYTIYNYDERIWGERTMIEVLEKSINTGAVFAEKRLGHTAFLNYLEDFGIFEQTGIGLQGEVFSNNEEFKGGYEINFATASFGQGIEMSPLQLALAYAAIANGGKLVKPYIVDRVGNVATRPEIRDNNVISRETSARLSAMLVSVIENGFAKAAKVPGYYIAGKTGTAQISKAALGQEEKGYSEKTWQSFVGFAPAFDPKFLILVKLDNPQTKTAEYSAVPIFHELAKYILDYYQIAPDYSPR